MKNINHIVKTIPTSSKDYNMTPSQAVAKARRELKKITNSDYAYLSNEYFIIGKLRNFINNNVNTKGHTNIHYHKESTYIESELNKILTWDKSQLVR